MIILIIAFSGIGFVPPKLKYPSQFDGSAEPFMLAVIDFTDAVELCTYTLNCETFNPGQCIDDFSEVAEN